MRLGLISDTHFQNWQAFGQCHENRISKRLLQQRDNFLHAVGVFQKERVDCIIHGGDWVHSVGSVSNEVLNISSEILRGLAVPILLVCGNHDTPVRIAPKDHHIITNILSQFSSMGVEKPFQSKNICLINYQDEVDYDKTKGYDLVVLHKTPVGSKLGNYTFGEGVDWQRLATQNKFVAFGHIHQTQILGDNCFIMGSPMQLGFGDIGKRGVWVVDTDSGILDFHKLDSPSFIVVDSPDQIKDDGNYYKVLGTKTKIDNDNVISVVVPEVFKERIKSQDFDGILREWVALNKKDDTYLEIVKDIVEEKLSLVKDLYNGSITKVTIKNFLSIGDVSYDVPATGFTLISGDSDSFSSNGSGKSSIMGESICWALFGETTKGLTGDDVIRRGQDDCSVEVVVFSKKDMREFTIKRTRKDGLEVNHRGNDHVSGIRMADRQTWLENFLGFNKQLFLASVYFSQENLLMLAKLTDSEKTNMITDLLGFEQYDELGDKVLAKIHKYEKEISEREDEKIMYEKDFAVHKEKISGLESAIADKDRQINDFNNTVKTYQCKIESLQTNGDIEQEFIPIDYDIQILTLTKSQESFSNKIEAVREAIDSVQVEYQEMSRKSTTLKVKIEGKTEGIETVKSEMDKLLSLDVNDRCDKCGAIITKENIDLFIMELKRRITHLKGELSTFETDLQTTEGLLREIGKRRLALCDKELGFIKDKSTIAPRVLELQHLRSKQEEKQKELLIIKEKAKGEINKYNSLIDDYSLRLLEVGTERHELNNERTGVACDVKLLESNVDRMGSIIGKTKVDIEKMEFWKIAFSPKGIRSVILDRFCNDINSTINGYLSTVSGGTMSIMITPTKTTKKGEERNKIGLSIQLDAQEVKYESLSGGEKRRVDVSLCFGLNKFVSDKYQVLNGLLGIVVLDEVFSFLDKSGEESVAELLWHEGQTKSVFVIDHALNLSSFADRIWIVKKNKGISTLEILKQ